MNPHALGRVLAVCVGRAEPLGPARRAADGRVGEPVKSAIRKQAVSTLEQPLRVELAEGGLWGDEQADPRVHGGPERAVYAYPVEHYAFWRTVRAQATRQDAPLAPGALGENLLIEGLTESDLWIGDMLEIGDARLRVTAPRTPCWKLDAAMGFSWASKMMVQSGFCGLYLAVARPGSLAAGDEILVRPGDRVLSVKERFSMKLRDRQPSLF